MVYETMTTGNSLHGKPRSAGPHMGLCRLAHLLFLGLSLLALVPGCRRTDVREMTVTMPELVEADKALPPVLAETCSRDGEKLALVQGDALRVSAEELAAAAGAEPNKLVSNLPYQVAATVILGALQHMPSVQLVVAMVQAEVADRIAARPGTKEYGAYTAKLSLFGRVTGRFEVGPHNFTPPPHVDSAVVRIERLAAPCADSMQVAEVIDAAFAQRRKTIRNSMSAKGYNKDVLDAADDMATLDEMEADHIRRAIDRCHGNMKLAAEQLGITRQTLHNKMKKLEV